MSDHPEPEPDTLTPKPNTIETPHSILKLRKIPHIPTRQRNEADTDDDDDKNINAGGGNVDPLIIDPATLGLNQIRTARSAPSPLRVSNLDVTPLGNDSVKSGGGGNGGGKDEADVKPNLPTIPRHSTEQGKKVSWSHSKSLQISSPRTPGAEGHNVALTKEMQSPRFQAILRVTSVRKKKVPDIKSFSHELNSKGVRPLPFWKSRALGHMEEIMMMIRGKFDKSKEEVNGDLGIFAGDLVGILENTSESHPEWRESLEDLLVIARQCAKMLSSEFWMKCEAIVQKLDDRRQELPMGILKQVHTRLLFILTRCSRLVQFQKESSYQEEHFLASHQLSDLGIYPERIFGVEKPNNPEGKPEIKLKMKDDNANETHEEVSTARSATSSNGSFRMSSWKKLPSAAERNRKAHELPDTPSREKPDLVLDTTSNIETPIFHPELSDESARRRVSWGMWDQHHLAYEDSFICRICEVEIPTVHVEQHSRICTIADRCDLKGLTLNERLERVADTLEKLLETWTPTDNTRDSPEVARLSSRYTADMMDYSQEHDNDLKKSHDTACENPGKIPSEPGSLTPRSPLATPRSSQIDLLLSGRKTMSEHESYEQIHKLLDLARFVANANGHTYSTLEYLLECLEELKYAIQDRKVDALVVETFGRRIEKLLQEKYVYLCGQIEDETHKADDESSVDEDTVRSNNMRTSPIVHSKDRTSIEDFEIIKPISRGAFGRVFLARKRATGDLFAIKVLKKDDMIRKNTVESILAERDILISVRNPFVVRFFYSFTCRENLYLVMEYLNGGDLFSLLKNLGCLEEDMARVYIAELVLALEYLHSSNIIHRDLKPDNLLIGPDGHIKLTDFGLSKVGLINSTDDLSGPSVINTAFLGDDDESNNKPKTPPPTSQKKERKKHSVVGTPDYLAPEILLGMGHGTTADWWSVGVILFELLVGIPPFNAEHPQQIFDNIMNRDIPWPKVPDEISYQAYDLIDKLLIENPVQRLGATGSKEVKRHAFFKDINWDTLARQKATFIPSAEALDTSYFMSRYIWNPEDENVGGGSDFDDIIETGSCSSGSYSNLQDEYGDECGNLAEFSNTPTLDVKYSFSNFSFKNLSQLASINYDMVIKNAKESVEASKPPAP